MDAMYAIGLWGGLVAAITGYLLIRYKHVHGHLSGDDAGGGPQKFHCSSVPRIGGVAIFLGFWCAMAMASMKGFFRFQPVLLLFLSSLPVFLGGLVEDFTKRVGPMARLFLAFVSAGLAFFLLDARLTRLGLPGSAWLLGYAPISFAMTAFAVGGVSNAVNIVDGFNGLSGMVCVMIFTALGIVCIHLDDTFLFMLCLSAIASTLGFLLWNFPKGLIFAGDGGAYFLGFLVGEISVLLLLRHPGISPWLPLLISGYPVTETLFSIFRRKFLHQEKIDHPDAMHLHQLIYKRMLRKAEFSDDPRRQALRNAMTSPYLWVLALCSIVPAVQFWNDPPMLVICAVGFAVLYVRIYLRIVRFRCPRFLVLRNGFFPGRAVPDKLEP